MPRRYSGEMPHGEKTSEFLFRSRSNYFHCDTTEWTNARVNTIDTFNRVMFLPTDYKAEFRLEQFYSAKYENIVSPFNQSVSIRM